MKFFLWVCLALLIIILSIIPFHQKTDLLIKAKYENVFSQLLKPINWKNWQPDVKAVWQHDSTKVYTTTKGTISFIEAQNLRIETKLNGFGLDVEKNTKWANEHYSFSVVTNQNHRYTDIHVITNTCGYKWLMALLTQKSLFADLQALKQYMEDEKAYYGFHINNITTVDTNVLVIKKTVPLRNKDSVVIAAQNQLHAYIDSHHYTITQPLMADIHATYGKDSIRIMMGIPIAQSPKIFGTIMLMQMPKLSRQIYITYTGKYGDRLACYNALRRYIADHALATPEVPYEKYLDNKVPLNNNDYTNMQIICPVQ